MLASDPHTFDGWVVKTDEGRSIGSESDRRNGSIGAKGTKSWSASHGRTPKVSNSGKTKPPNAPVLPWPLGEQQGLVETPKEEDEEYAPTTPSGSVDLELDDCLQGPKKLFGGESGVVEKGQGASPGEMLEKKGWGLSSNEPLGENTEEPLGENTKEPLGEDSEVENLYPVVRTMKLSHLEDCWNLAHKGVLGKLVAGSISPKVREFWGTAVEKPPGRCVEGDDDVVGEARFDHSVGRPFEVFHFKRLFHHCHMGRTGGAMEVGKSPCLAAMRVAESGSMPEDLDGEPWTIRLGLTVVQGMEQINGSRLWGRKDSWFAHIQNGGRERFIHYKNHCLWTPRSSPVWESVWASMRKRWGEMIRWHLQLIFLSRRNSGRVGPFCNWNGRVKTIMEENFVELRQWPQSRRTSTMGMKRRK